MDYLHEPVMAAAVRVRMQPQTRLEIVGESEIVLRVRKRPIEVQ